MTAIFTLKEIWDALAGAALLPAVERSFALYSDGHVNVPPAGELLFSAPRGDVHIKYAYITAAKYYLVKIASAFCRNVDL